MFIYSKIQNILKSIEKKQPRLRQLKKLHQTIESFVAPEATIFHNSYTMMEEMEKDTHQKFTLKLEEFCFVERQVNLLKQLLTGVALQLQQALEMEEHVLTAENLNNRPTSLPVLEVLYSLLT